MAAAAAVTAAPLTEQTFRRTRTQARGPRSFLFVVAELAELGALARLANIPDARRLPRAELQTISLMSCPTQLPPVFAQV